MSKLIAKLRSLFRVNYVESVGLPTNVDLRDPEQKEPKYTGPELEVKPIIKGKDDD